MKKVYIKWIDSGFSLAANVWQDYEDIKELLEQNKEVETVGFLVQETDDWFVLVQSINTQPSHRESLYRGGYFIYKPCVTHIEFVGNNLEEMKDEIREDYDNEECE